MTIEEATNWAVRAAEKIERLEEENRVLVEAIKSEVETPTDGGYPSIVLVKALQDTGHL